MCLKLYAKLQTSSTLKHNGNPRNILVQQLVHLVNRSYSVNKLSVKNVNRTKFLKDTRTNKLQAAIMTIISGTHTGNIYIQQKKKEKMYNLILPVMGEIGQHNNLVLSSFRHCQFLLAMGDGVKNLG